MAYPLHPQLLLQRQKCLRTHAPPTKVGDLAATGWHIHCHSHSRIKSAVFVRNACITDRSGVFKEDSRTKTIVCGETSESRITIFRKSEF